MVEEAGLDQGRALKGEKRASRRDLGSPVDELGRLMGRAGSGGCRGGKHQG